MYINKTIQNYSKNNTKHCKYKYTYYRNPHAIVKTPPHTLTHILPNKLKQPQYKIYTKWSSHNTFKYPPYKVALIYSYMVFCPQELHRNSLRFTSLIFRKVRGLMLFTQGYCNIRPASFVTSVGSPVLYNAAHSASSQHAFWNSSGKKQRIFVR